MKLLLPRINFALFAPQTEFTRNLRLTGVRMESWTPEGGNLMYTKEQERYKMPDYAYIHKVLQYSGVTLNLL